MRDFRYWHLPLFLVALLLGSCKKFLAQDSQDLVYADTAAKLDELMTGSGYESHVHSSFGQGYTTFEPDMYFPWLNVMDDDIAEFVPEYGFLDTRAECFGFYTWQSNPFTDRSYQQTDDDMWKKVYSHISVANTVAARTLQLHDDPDALQRIHGEALFLRASLYFQLVNIYATAYNKSSATTDPGVPLKTTDYVEDHFFSRSTVDSVYRQIVADLQEAATDLQGVTQPNCYHADANAADLLLSRVYLYMQDWANAAAAADRVVARKGQLNNLATFKTQTNFITTASPEAIFTQGSNAMIFITYQDATMTMQPSPELISLYDETDLRKNAFFLPDEAGKLRYAKVYWDAYTLQPDETFSDNFFLRNAEAYLNKAEAEAMQGHAAAACQAVNTLRQARFLPADYQPVSLSGQALVDFIRDERRRELCFEGHRWFDLKRYAVNEKYPMSKTIVHTWSDGDFSTPVHLEATLKLLPHDAAYVIPIPAYVITFNQGVLQQNPLRPDRQF